MSEEKSFGETLRQRRLEAGLSLDEMAERTRIRRQFLQALEEERFEIFPAETYLKGFLRNYAEALELDPDEIFALYRHTGSARPAQKAELHAIETELVEPVKRSASLGWMPLLFLLLLLAALAGAFYYFNVLLPAPVGDTQPPAISVEPPPEPDGQVPTPPAPVLEPEMPQAPETSVSPEPGEEEPVREAPAPEPAEESAPPQSEVQDAVPAEDAESRSAEAQAPEVIPAVEARIPPGGANIRLEVLESTGLEIVIDNRPPQSYVLRVGTTLTWRVRHSARIMLGDPSAVQVWLDGRPLDLEGHSEILLTSGEESVS